MYSQVLKPAGLPPRLEKRVPDPNKNGESSKPVPTVHITNNLLLCACRTPCPYNRDVTGSCYIASVTICSQLQSHNKSSGVIFRPEVETRGGHLIFRALFTCFSLFVLVCSVYCNTFCIVVTSRVRTTFQTQYYSTQ